jgi:DNA-binding MarR family transcriptional regulator/GNAT superfamily N-acetyltransferase
MSNYLSKPTDQMIEDIRLSSRQLIREFGFLGQTIAGSNLSASAVHALIEIDKNTHINSAQLAEKLLLEKSTVSRLINKLISKGYLSFSSNSEDARAKNLSLTLLGSSQLDEINDFARKQVVTAILPFDIKQQQSISDSMSVYANALKRVREQSNNFSSLTTTPAKAELYTVCRGYCPSLLADVVALHARFYSQRVNFGWVFETSVAIGMAQFLARLDKLENQIWYVKDNDKVIASISIDGQYNEESTGLLRWFIVDATYSGKGLGKLLMQTAMQHCERANFDRVELWTFAGLDTARALYEKHGFLLSDERLGTKWGKEVLEQKFVKLLGQKK